MDNAVPVPLSSTVDPLTFREPETFIPLPVTSSDPVITADPLYGNPFEDAAAYEADVAVLLLCAQLDVPANDPTNDPVNEPVFI